MSEFLCKTCIHSRCSKVATVFSYLFSWHAPDSCWYKCSKSANGGKIIDDPVVGPVKIKADYDYCAVARLAGKDKCGPDAKYWAPKKKKDLFKMLTRDQYD